MVFEKKSETIPYIRYTKDRKQLTRKLTFKRELAEETNKIVTVFNKESEAVKLNQSILTAIAFECFFKHLGKLSEEEALTYLNKKALEEAEK